MVRLRVCKDVMTTTSATSESNGSHLAIQNRRSPITVLEAQASP